MTKSVPDSGCLQSRLDGDDDWGYLVLGSGPLLRPCAICPLFHLVQTSAAVMITCFFYFDSWLSICARPITPCPALCS
ncbi:hypothetical protein BJX62DRAFT_198452 [Aspergillus germanicus]